MKENIPMLPRSTFEEVLGRLEKSFKPIRCTRCQKCNCVYGTEIHTLFRQYNYYFLGKDYWSLRKLDLGIEESVIKCKKCTDLSCMNDCPENLHIPILIQKIHELVKIHIRNSIV